MLYQTPALTSKDREVLESIDTMRQELRHQVLQTPTKWTSGLRRTLTAEAIAGSNSIEGYKLDSVDVEDLIDGEQEVAATEENKAETQAYQHAMTYIQSLHDVDDMTSSVQPGLGSSSPKPQRIRCPVVPLLAVRHRPQRPRRCPLCGSPYATDRGRDGSSRSGAGAGGGAYCRGGPLDRGSALG
jgi:hypothetical protein